jgi:UDP-N-acetyl-D-galactosamine dehydrogenase
MTEPVCRFIVSMGALQARPRHPRGPGGRPQQKENCPDLRNTRVIDILSALREYSITADCYDPWIDRDEARHEYGIDCLPDLPPPGTYDAIILAVAHRVFIEMGSAARRALGKEKCVLYDVKAALPADQVDGRL